MRNYSLLLIAASVMAVSPGTALAQDGAEGLSSLDTTSLRSELQQRYDAGLAATLDPAFVNADDARYLWASETKVQCGIALGYLRSRTRDETSISKCALAYDRMNRQPAPPAPIPAPPPPPRPTCPNELPGMVFFDFDSDMPPAEARQTVDFVAQNRGPCGWTSFTVTGHADRSGSDSYNLDLSRRRAEAVAGMMVSAGIPRTTITTEGRGESQPRVPTADGVREPQNRRVEITVR